MVFAADATERARRVRFIIFDVDGVLTDGGIYTGETGEFMKPFYVRDGLGIRLWQNEGFGTAIITGRASAIVSLRAAELKIEDTYLGHIDKRSAYADIKARHGLLDEEIAYIGDDIVDLPILREVGLPCAVGDAVPEVRETAQIIAAAPGGRGAVREIYEIILKTQGLWERILTAFQNDADGIAQ